MTGPVLVTGAAGRIGTVLREGLPERGWPVRSLDVVEIAGQVDSPEMPARCTSATAPRAASVSAA